MNNKLPSQLAGGMQTPNLMGSLTQPFDTPTAFIKRPVPIKSPISKDHNIAHSLSSNTERPASQAPSHSRNLNKSFHESPSKQISTTFRSLSLSNGASSISSDKENKTPQVNSQSAISLTAAPTYQAEKILGSP